MNQLTANRLELQQIVAAVAHEKSIEREVVIEAIEESMARAAKLNYGPELDIRADFNMETGELFLERVRTVVEAVEDNSLEVSLEDARRKNPDAVVGSQEIEYLPPVFGARLDRITVQNAKQIIVQKVREAEREKQYHEYKDKIGQIVVGTVNRIEYGNIIVDLAVGEGIIHRNQRIRQEAPEKGDRLRALVLDVSRENKRHQIRLSRTAPEFMKELFRAEVPEFDEGIVDIRCIARDPGSRAKIAVVSYDASIDPVGACVGMKGSRVQAVVSELQGERIDVIGWTPDQNEFVEQAIKPAKVSRIILDEDDRPAEIIVYDDQLSLAIGAKGQNVRLARTLTGLNFRIITESEERDQRLAADSERVQTFMDVIDIEESFAHLLVTEGFDSVEQLADCDMDLLLAIDGIDSEIGRELRNRAQSHVDALNQEALEEAFRYGLQQDLAQFEGLTPAMLLTLAKADITTLKGFAECADWEIAGGYSTSRGRRVRDPGFLEEFEVSLEEARHLILVARVLVGLIDESSLYEADLDIELEEGIDERQIEET
ncbi:MAG: transcription termination factor NusA [Rhodobacteraceae bacterium]|nr:transcription termination factor NusA [Paracoccaceae bacterium]